MDLQPWLVLKVGEWRRPLWTGLEMAKEGYIQGAI